MGFNKVRYRLQIEGFPIEWVTDSSLAALMGDKRYRKVGLKYEGLRIEERLDLRESRIELSPMTARIVSKEAIKYFARKAVPAAWLNAEESYSDTSFVVDAIGGLAVNDYLHVGTEVVKITNVAGATLTVTRQQWDTQRQAHYKKAGDAAATRIPVYLAYDASADVLYPPPSMEGRRAYLFKYQAGEVTDSYATFDFATDTQGSTLKTADNLIWRGVVSQAAMQTSNPTQWEIRIEPITMLLEQELAAISDRIAGIAGIYCSAKAAITIGTIDWDAAVGSQRVITKITGIYATEEEMVTAINAVLETRRAAFTNVPTKLSFDKNHRLTIVMGNPVTKCNVMIVSPLLGCTEQDWRDASDVLTIPASLLASATYHADQQVSPYYDNNPSNPRVACLAQDNPPHFPRAVMPGTYCVYVDENLCFDSSAIATMPPYRIYHTGQLYGIVAVGDTVLCDNILYDQTRRGVEVEASEATYIDVVMKPKLHDKPFFMTGETTLTPVHSYGTASLLSDFIETVCDESYKANLGDVPFVTKADLEADAAAPRTVWSASVAASKSAGQFARRNYTFFHAIPLVDVLAEELKLIGCYMRLCSDGRIGVARLEHAVSTDASATAIGSAHIITPYAGRGMWPSFVPAEDGVVSTVRFERGYNAEEDSHKLSPIEVIDIRSMSHHKNRTRGKTTIEPKSRAADGRDEINAIEAAGVATRYFAFHACDYSVVEIEVALSLFDSIVCGNPVLLTSPHVPNIENGTRGVTSQPAVVIGRSWSLDPAEGTGKLTLRINHGNYSGYAPAARLSGATNVTGNQWVLSIASDTFSQYYDLQYFDVLDLVVVRKFDDTTNTCDSAVVDAIAADYTTITVTFDTGAPWGGAYADTYDIEFLDDIGTLVSTQRDFVYVADSNGYLQPGTAARQFA